MTFITTIEEIKQYIAIDENTSVETLLPYIAEAELLFLVDLLGKDFYEELLTDYSENTLDEAQEALLPYVQRCLAYYMQLLAIPHLSVTFGDMGIRQHRGDDSDAAPRWKEDKLQFQAIRNGDIHADKLLEYLEANASPTKYGTWFASTSNTKNSGYLVYGTAIASQHIDINGSRRVFLRLRNKIREIETRIIPKLIGKDQYDELVTQLQTGGGSNPTTANKALIAKLQPIICKRALYMQLPFMRIQVNEHGIFVYSGADDIFKLGQLAGDAEIKVLRHQLADGEFGYLADEAELNQFILDNINSYPLIKASTAYTTQPDPGPTWRSPEPNPDSKWFTP
jgi:hypothetical protein